MVGFKVVSSDVTDIELHEDFENEINNIAFSSSCFHAANDKRNVRAVIDVTLLISKRFRFTFKYNMYFKLDHEVDEAELVTLMDNIGLHKLAYPYIRSYAMSVLSLSGFNELNLPMIPKF